MHKWSWLSLFLGLNFWGWLNGPVNGALYGNTDSLKILAYGDLRGYLEPCGCDPLTDLGGVKRIHNFLQLERQHFGPILVLSLGNILAPEKKGWKKTPFLLRAEALLKPDALLVNRLEIASWDQMKASYGQDMKDLPWVLSNGSLKGVSTVRTKDSVEIYGFLSPQKGDGLQSARLWLQTLKKGSSNNKPSVGKKRVLLFSGSREDLAILWESRLFDKMIASHESSLETLPTDEARKNETLLKRFFGKTEWVYQVPLGGQGVLRQGALTQGPAPRLDDLLKKKEPEKAVGGTPLGLGNPLLERAYNVTWMSKDYSETPESLKLMKEYEDVNNNDFQTKVAERRAFLKTSPYVGADVCQGCHSDAYKAWKASRHSQAWVTLETKGKDKDSECIQCHVLAFDKEGGFVSKEESPQFAHVQCENCHGPRKAHVQNPTAGPKIKADLQNCVTCHNPLHSPQFKPELYWSRIKHGHGL